MRCSRAQELLTLYLLKELDPPRRAEVEAHLAECPACRAELEAARSFLEVLDGAMASVPAAADLERRVMADVGATPVIRRVKAHEVPEVPPAADEVEFHLQRRTTAQLIAAAAVILIAAVVWLVVPRAGAQVRVEKVEYSVTVYNDDLALVRDVRRLVSLKEGRNEVRLDDVPSQIDPTSVSFRSTTDPGGTTVLDQNYEYDLASPDKILAKYIDRQIETVSRKGDYRKDYLAGFNEGQLVVTERPGGGQTRMLARAETPVIMFERLPEGLLTKPTLIWKVNAKTAGVHEMVVSYLTAGMSWRCNYVLVQRSADKVDLKAWVTIDNQSGASYPKAKLKLMAGDVNRVQEPEYLGVKPGVMDAVEKQKEEKGFEEKSFFEYHLYTLGRETDLANESTKQIELTSALGVGTATQYVFDGQGKVGVYLTFKNSKDNNLGIALPKGVVRVMKEDVDGSLEFMGEDEIDHTPKDEEVRVLTGNAFDLVGERKVLTDQRVGKSRTATIQVKLRNHKPTPVAIAVREHIDNDWRITKTSHPLNKDDKFAEAHTAVFDIPVAADGEASLTFTYVATW